jgi:transposase
LESARKKTRPRTVDLYDVFCAALYVLKSGCQWRMLPSDFPKWRTVYAYFEIWSEEIVSGTKTKRSMLDQVLKKIGWRGPKKQWAERTDNLRDR